MTRSGGIYPHKQATYDRIPHQRLRGGTAPLPQILRCEVLHHHGGDDDRRHLAAVQRRGPGPVHRVFLHRTGGLPPAGGLLFACSFAKAALARQGARRNIRNTARMEQFWDTVSKLLFFVGQDGSIAVKQRSVRTKRRFLYAVLTQIPLDSPSAIMV